MFSLSFVEGSKSAEGGPNPLADLDRGVHIRSRIWTGGPNLGGGVEIRWDTGSGVDTEVELILAGSSIFSFPSNISDMDICPAHRSSVGTGWRRGLARCRIPAQLSKHVRKSRTTDRGISKDISRLILRITGIFFPVGSSKCPFE